MRKLYEVYLTADERDQLRALSTRRDVQNATKRRAEILLMVDAGQADVRIADTLKVARATVERTRRRFAKAGSLMAYIEAGELPMTLTQRGRQVTQRDHRRRQVQALARQATPLQKPGTQVRPGRGRKTPLAKRPVDGNRSRYLVNRIARDHPDILDRMKRGEFSSVRAAAVAAGIIRDRQATHHTALTED